MIDVSNDGLGRTRSITGFVSGIKYFANGVLSDMQYTNGSVFKSTLNANKLPEMVRTLNGSNTIVNLNYAYDADNNVSSITDYRDSINTRTMDYDGLGRMTKANGRWGAGNFTYNDNHDISTLNLGSKHIAYHYNATGKLASTTGTVAKNFSYDHYGNVSGNGKDNFIYDDANQMLRVSNQNINYTYDGNKKRVKVKTPSKTVYYFYNLAGELLYRYDKTNKKDIEYINLNGKLIAKFEQSRGRSNRTTYYHYDLLGSPVANTNASGNIVWREEYSPWGKKLLNQDATKDNVRGYTGHVHDKETGLTYMQARYYDPDIMRFMGIDPVGFKESNPIMFNRYAYANNNPFKFRDPNGEAAKKIVDVFAKISAKYDNLQCDSCAREMIDAAEKSGVSGKLVSVKAKQEIKNVGVWSDKENGFISKNSKYYGIELDANAKVYDNNTPDGISRNKFENDLHHASGDVKFKNTPFSVKEGYKKAKDPIYSIGTSIGILGTAISSTISEEVEAAYNDPGQAVVDWSVLSDIAGEPVE